jgi:hypothetical protein
LLNVGARWEYRAAAFAFSTAIADPTIERIESFACRRGRLLAESRNRGYTLPRATSGATVARLPQTGPEDGVEVLYWSLWKERWTSAGRFGRIVLPLEDAHRFIASEDIFRAIRSASAWQKIRKVDASRTYPHIKGIQL